MRILVAGDTHGREYRLQELCALHPEAHALLFLGDGVRAATRVVEAMPNPPLFLAVRGNNDLGVPDPDVREEFFAGRRVYMTHGHLHRVKAGLVAAVAAARAHGAHILLFGHTHVPHASYEDGLYLLNPGSLGYDGSYGLLDITAAGVVCHVATLK